MSGINPNLNLNRTSIGQTKETLPSSRDGTAKVSATEKAMSSAVGIARQLNGLVEGEAKKPKQHESSPSLTPNGQMVAKQVQKGTMSSHRATGPDSNKATGEWSVATIGEEIMKQININSKINEESFEKYDITTLGEITKFLGKEYAKPKNADKQEMIWEVTKQILTVKQKKNFEATIKKYN
ncbi:MAG: hypothetical protein CL521_03160 [Actinobacteria bacterium]|nr:hypothetical protein [Actinomycetota bacterium]